MNRVERNAWTDRYMITSVRGRIYTRTMLRVLAMKHVKSWTHTDHEPYVDAVLDDHAWMRRRKGETPSSLASDIEREAWRRWYDATERPGCCK